VNIETSRGLSEQLPHLVARHARLDLREIPLAHDLTDVFTAWSEPTVTMKVCLPSGPPGYSQTSEPSAFLRTVSGLPAFAWTCFSSIPVVTADMPAQPQREAASGCESSREKRSWHDFSSMRYDHGLTCRPNPP